MPSRCLLTFSYSAVLDRFEQLCVHQGNFATPFQSIQKNLLPGLNSASSLFLLEGLCCMAKIFGKGQTETFALMLR